MRFVSLLFLLACLSVAGCADSDKRSDVQMSKARPSVCGCVSSALSMAATYAASACTGRPERGASASAATPPAAKRANQLLGQHIPKATVAELAGAAHFMIATHPKQVAAIIARLHAKDPAQRYQSAAEVADLLGRCLAHVQQPLVLPLPPTDLPAAPPRRAEAP